MLELLSFPIVKKKSDVMLIDSMLITLLYIYLELVVCIGLMSVDPANE